MTTALSQALATPATLEIKGKLCKFKPLSMGDFAKFERLLQSNAIQRVKDQLEGLPADLQASMLKTAIDGANRLTLGAKEGRDAAFTSISSMCELLFLAHDKKVYRSASELAEDIGVGAQEQLVELISKLTGLQPEGGTLANPTVTPEVKTEG